MSGIWQPKAHQECGILDTKPQQTCKIIPVRLRQSEHAMAKMGLPHYATMNIQAYFSFHEQQEGFTLGTIAAINAHSFECCGMVP